MNLRATETEHQPDQVDVRPEGGQPDAVGPGRRRAWTAPGWGCSRPRWRCSMAQQDAAPTPPCARPSTGVVTAKLKNEGEMATMMPPTVVLVVQDQSVLELRFRLPEKAADRGQGRRGGDGATSRRWASPATAKVARIQPAVDARTRTVEVVAEIPNPDGALQQRPAGRGRAGAVEDASRARQTAAKPRAADEARRHLHPPAGLRDHADRVADGVRPGQLPAHRRRPVPQRRVPLRHRDRGLPGRRPGLDGDQGRRSARGSRSTP